MNPAPELGPQLKQLRLSGILDSLEARNREAIHSKLAYTDFLALLIGDEVARREQKKFTSRLRRAQFRTTKTLDQFDFDVMSKLLTKSAPKENLSKNRKKRIEKLLTTLKTQQFFPSPHSTSKPYVFAFESCSEAIKAYRERLPKAIELAKAVAVAELEVRGEYSEAKHDRLFESFGENGLDPRDMALFPDYLVQIDAESLPGGELGALTEIMSLNLPIKVLVQTDDVIEESPIGNGHLAFALRSRQLARMALGMAGVFVVQAPASARR